VAGVEFRIWGRHPVEEALASPAARVFEVWASEPERLDLRGKAKLRKAGRDELTRLAGTDKHQNVVARVELRTLESCDELTAPGRLLVAVDEVQDPHNLGSLCRSAHFFGASALILPKDRTAPITGTVAKSSAGALFSLPIVRVTNLARELKLLADLAYWRVGLDASAPQPLSELKIADQNLALVLGGEGEGLRSLTAKSCDVLVALPGGGRDSLNVAVAGAIALYEVTRSRRG
jgi:23S rRNA (guanosine2251-2'-O)-methyltransferase